MIKKSFTKNFLRGVFNMNVKKTIASIAAIAMVASATSLAPLFTGTSISADELVGAETPETETNPEDELIEDPNAGISLFSVADTDHSGHTTANTVDGISGATGTVTTEDGTVTVTLTQTSEAAIEGTAHGGVDQYHVIIPVDGIGDGWSFDSGYNWDDGDNHSFNISENLLRLWLPITAKEDGYTIVLKKDSETKTIVVKTVVVEYEAPAPTLTVTGGSVDQGGTGTVAVDGTTVTVTLDNASEGLPQEGDDDGTPNYHVVIPVTGLTTDWVFDASSEYQFDSNANKTWNIDDGQLKLWLPIESGTCRVVLKKDDTTVTIVVTTVNGSTIVTPVPPVVTEPTEPTDAEKLETAIATLEDGYFNWDFTWIDVNDQGHLDNLISQAAANAGVEGTEVSLVNYTTGSNGMVTFTIKFKVGTEEVTRDVTLQCKAPEAPVVPDTPVTIPDPIIYVPGTGVSVSVSSEAISNAVSSPAQITASRKAEITVNAADTEVTPAMVEAFVKNKNAKTLTLQYSSALKVSVNKSDINDADANLDFSVTGEKFLSSKTIKNNKTLKKASKVVQIDFVNKGDLEGIDKVTIKSKAGIGYAGKTVTIYEYVNGKLVKVGVGKVNGAGLVKFDTDHLGQFVIAVQ